MGYYDGADVPVYDHLAEQFAVCDRWFSSVPDTPADYAMDICRSWRDAQNGKT